MDRLKKADRRMPKTKELSMSVKPTLLSSEGMMSGRVRGLYTLLLLMMALTGFGQMPIFKRYYIADLPGLGWLAAYFVTHFMHYLGAALLLGMGAYFLVRYMVLDHLARRITGYGLFQGGLMLTVVVTGILRVIKNYEGYYLSSGLIVFLDIVHLVAVMLLLAAGAWGLAAKKRWTTLR
jgi:hypothetical protein